MLCAYRIDWVRFSKGWLGYLRRGESGRFLTRLDEVRRDCDTLGEIGEVVRVPLAKAR